MTRPKPYPSRVARQTRGSEGIMQQWLAASAARYRQPSGGSRTDGPVLTRPGHLLVFGYQPSRALRAAPSVVWGNLCRRPFCRPIHHSLSPPATSGVTISVATLSQNPSERLLNAIPSLRPSEAFNGSLTHKFHFVKVSTYNPSAPISAPFRACVLSGSIWVRTHA